VYCGRNEKLTKEDVWPVWITRLFGVRKPEFTNVFESVLGTPRPTLTWDSVGDLGQKVAVVCRGCNGGWMSNLERRAIQMMPRMIFPSGDLTLSVDDQRALATWVSKTHQMYRFGLVGRAPTDAARTYLYQNSEPPPNTFTSLAAWKGTSPSFLDIRAHLQRFFTKRDAADEGHEFEAELLTIRIGYLVIQTIELSAANDLAIQNADLRMDQVVLPLWPVGGSPIQWPPAIVLDDVAFEKLDGRWHRAWRGNPAE
jgi:hypothetical protein